LDYIIPLIRVQSNLGKGWIYYFLCPETKKRCSKLYLLDERFVGLAAAKDGFYQKELRPKKLRSMDKENDRVRKLEKAVKKMADGYLTYGGQPTKRLLQGIEAVSELNRLDHQWPPYPKIKGEG
jgi:hypothetical protein